MRVILTGARGFLGSYIKNELSKDGEVFTISRKGASLRIDLSREIPSLPEVDLVIHCAGKAHSIPKTYAEKRAFFDVNLNGTENLLKGLENCEALPKAFVFISTVAVYGIEYGQMINENHALNASDPYGLSKIQAEQLIQRWCEINKVICTILRLPLLAGENPPGNLGAMIKGIQKGYYFNIAGGSAKKSMVLAEDVAKIIPEVSKIGGIFNLTDGHHPTFAELSYSIAKKMGKGSSMNVPFWVASIMAKFGDFLGNMAPINSKKLAKITANLTFDDSKAKKELNWKPNSVLSGLKIDRK
ncbi:MAG: NAD-dependent epimerase/dehydratase family protein [Chitinophagaceae bacterium]|nr:MAG: NAD-dependent epimerase/dehydratase family protein [Chitinophagaceae bacterium]